MTVGYAVRMHATSTRVSGPACRLTTRATSTMLESSAMFIREDVAIPDIQETLLPGVGVRHEFTTARGERVALVVHRTGRRELATYDRDDPDVCRTVLHLSGEDTAALGALLGTIPVSETVRRVQRLEGVAMEWITVEVHSPAAGWTIADGEFRTRTGTSIVAIIRGESTVPAPELMTRLDVVVAVGTPDGLQRGALDLIGMAAEASPTAVAVASWATRQAPQRLRVRAAYCRNSTITPPTRPAIAAVAIAQNTA